MSHQLPNVPCPQCSNSTTVITGHVANLGYTRRRTCKVCGCKFSTFQAKGATIEVVSLVLVKGNAPTDPPDPDDADEIEVAEPEPGANMSLEQMRRVTYIGALNDVKWFGRLQPETLGMAATVQQKKMRVAA